MRADSGGGWEGARVGGGGGDNFKSRKGKERGCIVESSVARVPSKYMARVYRYAL